VSEQAGARSEQWRGEARRSVSHAASAEAGLTVCCSCCWCCCVPACSSNACSRRSPPTQPLAAASKLTSLWVLPHLLQQELVLGEVGVAEVKLHLRLCVGEGSGSIFSEQRVGCPAADGSSSSCSRT
jgi:hypothetical protein